MGDDLPFLPNEILVNILNQIQHPKTFVNMCSTCKDLVPELEKIHFCLFRYINCSPNEFFTDYNNQIRFKEYINNNTLQYFKWYLKKQLDIIDS